MPIVNRDFQVIYIHAKSVIQIVFFSFGISRCKVGIVGWRKTSLCFSALVVLLISLFLFNGSLCQQMQQGVLLLSAWLFIVLPPMLKNQKKDQSMTKSLSPVTQRKHSCLHGPTCQRTKGPRTGSSLYLMGRTDRADGAVCRILVFVVWNLESPDELPHSSPLASWQVTLRIAPLCLAYPGACCVFQPSRSIPQMSRILA